MNSQAGGGGDSDAWHTLTPKCVAERLVVRPDHGLDSEEAAHRALTHGANRLPEQPPPSAWMLFLGQFKSILILVLILAAALAAFIGDAKDAIVILTVVLLNAVFGFYQEHQAGQSLAALKDMLPTRARVRREGAEMLVSAAELVPGDVVLLQAGDRVPADGRLSLAAELSIDESTLTGESQPAQKSVALIGDPDVSLAERLNIAHMNTTVTSGRGEMIVTATGVHTEMGRISLELAATPELRSPLQAQLDQLGKRLGASVLTLVLLLSFLELMRGSLLSHVILDSIALAVAGVPEGLPVVVTVTLALGMRRMAQRRAIVKRLASVETLGCTTVICSDKTGTLTLNQMTVRAFCYRGQCFEVTGEGYETTGAIRSVIQSEHLPDLSEMLVPLVACNDSRVADGRVIGDPMEGALIVLAAKGGVDQATVAARLPRIAEIPFDSAHKFMATFHRAGDTVRLYVKGAPDVLQGRCTRLVTGAGEQPFDAIAASTVETEYRAFAERGRRGLLVAARMIASHDFTPEDDLLRYVSDLTFVGLVGLMDPPRPEVRDAISVCKTAGIAVKMITGDHPDTAVAIAREIGLAGGVLTGAELDRIDDSRLAEIIDPVTVFARVAPEHKVKIVRALQAIGHVVAMTGDGVNDAPALKHADIGVAMGINGTEVSKEAASMVLTDDNFATIVSAVREGRKLYDNILKFVRFQLSTTTGAIMTVFFAPLAGLPEPFNPIQILWIAMIMDGPPAVALALDAARPGIMGEPPRPRHQPVLPFVRLARILAFGLLMMAGTLGILHCALRTEPVRAVTLAFTVFVLFQFFNVFNCRAERESAFNRSFFANRMLWASLAAVAGLQVVVVHWAPAQSIFGTVDLEALDWCVGIAVASSILVLEEARKWLARVLA